MTFDVKAALDRAREEREGKELSTLARLATQLFPLGCEAFEDKAIGQGKLVDQI